MEAPRPRLRVRPEWWMLAALATASGAEAQVIQGRLLQSENGPGLGGAMITLVNRQGQQMSQVLSRDDGAFDLSAPGPGEYQLRADRIGHASTLSDYFDLAAQDTLTFQLVAEVQAISLGEIDVRGDRRCRVRPEEGLAVTRVWEEARKALAAAAWTQERGVYQYEMMEIQRLVERDGRKVISEDRSFQRGYRKAPYVALPAEELIGEGFARLRLDQSVYYAPDAGVLLSDAFLDTHCFQLDEGEDEAEGLLGLAFEPIRGRSVPEIEGTLWLDRETAELKWLDFRYRNLNIPTELISSLNGGRVEFRALPNGTWIVNSWRIQMPRGTTVANPITHRRQPYLEGYAVQGGEVLRVHGNEGTVLEGDLGGRIVGAVFDSLRTSGLPGARVYLEDSGIEVTTDRNGRFEFTYLDPGQYSVNFSHPYLDRFSYVGEPFEVEVVEGSDTPSQINFLAPATSRVIQSLCRAVEPPDEGALVPGAGVHDLDGILIGRVTDQTGTPVADATVRILWREYDIRSITERGVTDTRIREGRVGTAVKTNAGGYYLACWVPPGISLDVAVLDPSQQVDPGRIGSEYNMSEILASRQRDFRLSVERIFDTLDLTIERK